MKLLNVVGLACVGLPALISATVRASTQVTANHRLTYQPELQLACGAVSLAVLALQFHALIVYQRDQRFLRQLMDRIANPALPPSEQLKCIVSSFRDTPFEQNDKFFLASMFCFLRSTPRQVAEFGGNCSDRCRLVVVLLRLRGISASKWAIYSSALAPCHSVVEVMTEGGKMAVDPSFGLWFPRPDRGYFGVEDLRNNPEILTKRIQELLAKGNPNGLASLAFYPLDKYTFTYARTINWDKSWIARLLYRLLHYMIGAKANRILRPTWAEQPALMVLYLGFLVELLCLGGVLM